MKVTANGHETGDKLAWMVYDYPENGREKHREARCPLCGEACETIYRDMFHAIVGCDECMTVCDAWETEECFM